MMRNIFFKLYSNPHWLQIKKGSQNKKTRTLTNYQRTMLHGGPDTRYNATYSNR